MIAARRPAASTRLLRVALGLLGAMVVATAVIFSLQPSPGAQQAATPLLGRAAPPLAGPQLWGPPLPATPGRWEVVNFFASWCVDCRIEAAALNRFAATRAASVVMVAFADPPGAARSFLSLTGSTATAIADPKGQVALAWGVREPPETFVVAPSGKVVARFVGPVRAAQLEAVVASRP